MPTLRITKDLFDIFHPIGTYYETSNANFNPNTEPNWYGTWVQDTKGQTMVSKSDSGTFKTLGADVGSENHYHLYKIGFIGYYHAFIGGDNLSNHGAYSYQQGKYSRNYGIENNVISTNANGGVQSSSNSLSDRIRWSEGDTNSSSNVQPSKVCIRWHRTAQCLFMATLKIGTDLQNLIKKIVLDTYYPIGKLYLSVGNENPNQTIGGTQVKLSGYYLYADTSVNNTSYTGKHTRSHILTIEQIPSHNHIKNSIGWANSDPQFWVGSGGYTTLYFDRDTGVTGSTGGGQGHSHNIATKGIYVWQRTA